MRYLVPITFVLCLACGGSLSDEQRKRMQEQMKLQEIKKVSDVEITEAAFARGRQIMGVISGFENDPVKKDSVIQAAAGTIRWIVPGSANALEIEQQLIDAYLMAASGEQTDNVQELRTTEGKSDSLLYTKPVVTQMPDGTDRLDGVWNVWLSKKQLILSMDKK